MEQENTAQGHSTPNTPLRQISADRFNQINQSHQIRIPQSPSMPAYLNEGFEPRSNNRRESDIARAADVKAKIAFLNNLAHIQNGSTATNSFAIAGSPTRSPVKSTFGSPSKTHSRVNSGISIPADQSDLAALVQSLHSQLEQSRNRERLVSERVESMMEQLSSAHSRARHEKQAYEKEVKAVNKMQYKSELALIRCQEELREARNEQEGFKIRAEHERLAKEKSRQDAFERARTLASNMEELEVVKRERDMLRTENDTLKAVQNSMDFAAQNEPEVESREIGVQTIFEIAPTQEISRQCDCLSRGKAIQEPQVEESEIMQELQEELEWVKSQLKREKDLVHFMNMQCQFRACPCREAEKHGVRFVHDYTYDNSLQAIAQTKGIKRKAEDELPLPRYVTLRESMDQKSRERQVDMQDQEQGTETDFVSQPEQCMEVDDSTGMSEQETTPRALRDNDYFHDTTAAGVIPLDEAAEIPLPSPRSDDLEPTALLEDMTQVMVEPEPAATEKHFAFSTSMSSRRPTYAETPTLRQSHSAVSQDATEDLFDMAPPRHLPPRPSTVMGIRTTGSPIRMVPPSPQQVESYTPATSPPRYRAFQVPLKDTSPLRQSVTLKRSRSRSNTRNQERARARSPTPGYGMADAHSPVAATFFPVTPKAKQDRHPRVQVHVQSNSQMQSQQSQSQTTTTMVPLRGLEDDDMFSPDKSSHTYQSSHAQPQGYPRGRQPLAESDANTHQNILPGTPITREAALAQIRARRDRARSVNMRKQANSYKDEESGRVKTPKSVARRGVMLNRDGRDISNLSQASAPARF